MKKLQTFEGFRKGQDYSKPNYPYIISVKYEHGDADFNTKRKFEFKTKEELNKVLDFLIKVRNFIPGEGFGNLGYYKPVTGNDGGKEVNDLFDEDTFDKYEYYLEHDRKYNQGYASIEGISLKINNEPHIILDKKAAETNLIDLPKPGDIITFIPDHISGYGDIFDENEEYLPNSGKKDYIKDNFKAKVIDCKISEDDYMKWGITNFHYITLYETDEKVLKSGEEIYKFTSYVYGWDKNFGKKFNKDEFDDLRIYIYE